MSQPPLNVAQTLMLTAADYLHELRGHPALDQLVAGIREAVGGDLDPQKLDLAGRVLGIAYARCLAFDAEPAPVVESMVGLMAYAETHSVALL